MQAYVECYKAGGLTKVNFSQIPVHCFNLPENHVAYNPSSVFRVSEDRLLFVRLEPFPYAINTSSVWLARIELIGNALPAGLRIQLVKPVKHNLSIEDPYVFELSEKRIILGVVELVENLPQMRFCLIPRIDLGSWEEPLNLQDYPNFTGPVGMKGIRFYNDVKNKKAVVFFRPHKAYHQGSFWREADPVLEGVVTKFAIQADDVSDMAIFEMFREAVKRFNDSSYLMLPYSFGQDTFHWTGLNGLIPWGDKILLICHVGKIVGTGAKFYKSALFLVNQNFEIESPALEISREKLLIETRYNPEHFLYNVVYPSGPSVLKTQACEQLLILCGVSDCSIGGVLLEGC